MTKSPALDDNAASTREMLARHHRGPEFSTAMETSFPNRFNEAFWSFWQQYIHPVLPARPTLVDFGTGPGLLLREWAQRYPQGQLIGVELMPYMLEKAQHHLADLPEVQLIQSDLHDPRLPLPAGSVDAAQAVVVLHEMTQPIRLLQATWTLLKPGGRLLVVDWVRAPIALYFDEATVNQLFDPATDLDLINDRLTHFYEHNRFSADDLIWLVQQVGFVVVGQELYNQSRFLRLALEKRV